MSATVQGSPMRWRLRQACAGLGIECLLGGVQPEGRRIGVHLSAGAIADEDRSARWRGRTKR